MKFVNSVGVCIQITHIWHYTRFGMILSMVSMTGRAANQVSQLKTGIMNQLQNISSDELRDTSGGNCPVQKGRSVAYYVGYVIGWLFN
jgi:hypothetical protein